MHILEVTGRIRTSRIGDSRIRACTIMSTAIVTMTVRFQTMTSIVIENHQSGKMSE